MSKKESPIKTIVVALVLSLVCSIVVSYAAIGLKPQQEMNKELDRKLNILMAAGMVENPATADVNSLFEQVEHKIVDLATGEFVEEPASFNQRKFAKDPSTNAPADGLDGIAKRSQFADVYIVRKDGKLDSLILPMHGKGLFSTLYGFVALDSDLETLKGIKYYEQGETAGLGAEVENPLLLAKWPGKQALDSDGEPVIKLVKTGANADNEVDALSGATMTSRGVENMLHFWLGDNGFGPFLDKAKAGGL